MHRKAVPLWMDSRRASAAALRGASALVRVPPTLSGVN